MINDFIAQKITDSREKLNSLTEADQSVINAAFHYLKATCLTKTDKKRPDEFREAWTPHVSEHDLRDFVRVVEVPVIHIDQMSLLTFHLSFTFKLSKPYLSRDDDSFYIVDNPVKKEKVFKLPYVSPGTYKGAMRAAARQLSGRIQTAENEIDRPEIERLFGIDKQNEERIEAGDFNAGRMYFFPTFFRQIGLEIINPHDRTNGAGTLPIQFETAKAQQEGRFNLLYFPFALDHSPQAYNEMAADLVLIARAVREVFTVYGFGAKTSSGFGIANVITDGRLRMRFDEMAETKVTAGLQRPDDLAEFFTAEGRLKEFTEYEMSQWGKPRRQRYGRARRWVERTQAEAVAAAEAPPLVAKPVSERLFSSFQGLIDVANELAGKLRSQGGAGV